ncbi:TM2 domain-containing protein [Mycoplasma tullyi]|uniref:TM2 domain-containing protein n=1 Tax=Mycoplasma tullyi TaxID=1612150 RepID=A0A7D7UB43_9MOLU|nr:TM2 domain-containing protein [Mycoplasma tullyi]QMT98784.1 TM2 domain-containing protein [Mycoplasma tullyi]
MQERTIDHGGDGASPKCIVVLSILSFLFGYLGVDRFYSGRMGLGVLKLITAGGLGFWWIWDFITAVMGKQKDVDRLPITKNRL